MRSLKCERSGEVFRKIFAIWSCHAYQNRPDSNEPIEDAPRPPSVSRLLRRRCRLRRSKADLADPGRPSEDRVGRVAFLALSVVALGGVVALTLGDVSRLGAAVCGFAACLFFLAGMTDTSLAKRLHISRAFLLARAREAEARQDAFLQARGSRRRPLSATGSGRRDPLGQRQFLPAFRPVQQRSAEGPDAARARLQRLSG